MYKYNGKEHCRIMSFYSALLSTLVQFCLCQHNALSSSVRAERVGREGGCHPLQLHGHIAVVLGCGRTLLALSGPFLSCFVQTGLENASLTL